MKTTKLGLVLGAMVVGLVLVGTGASDIAGVAQADEGPSGHALVAAPSRHQGVNDVSLSKAEEVQVSTAVKPTTTPAVAEATLSCPKGMVEVEGDYCSTIEQRCLRWLDPDVKMRCRCAARNLRRRRIAPEK
jgi:hypothetical protein